MTLPRYPVYVPTKGRWATCYTAQFLTEDQVPFSLVVEPQEADSYRAAFPAATVLELPFRDRGSVIPARNWIREHAQEQGHRRHWQIDDNCTSILRLYRGLIVPANAGIGLRVCEDLTDRYTNVAISGLNYEMFVTEETRAPFTHNCHVYSCSLVDNAAPIHWRGRYNEDTDLCLQALSQGLCTIALNVFVIKKLRTMILAGGNTDELYAADGRARMSRSLERQWPYVVETKRKYQRPQHHIRGTWKAFDHPLIRRDDIDWDALPRVDEYGMDLTQTAPQIRSPRIQRMYDDWHQTG